MEQCALLGTEINYEAIVAERDTLLHRQICTGSARAPTLLTRAQHSCSGVHSRPPFSTSQ
jgi:hypothetical protein